MPEQNTSDNPVVAVDDAAVVTPVDTERAPRQESINAVEEIINKINESKYILIALSGGPSIDELAAAIGLTTYLNKLKKRATAIYSGGIPEALGFLEAGEAFDHSADVLQDFVISLNKDKADHLRYKPEGDFVKIFITPYKDKVTSDDLEFSYGDFNVDLVIALNVTSGIDLDDALREYGTIMQDATIVNIAASRPGKLGDIEWSNPQASSVSEMVAHLLHEMNAEVPVGKDEANAFFAGIVSATNRFSNASTTPFTLTVSSWLMECGANQQLVAENITAELDNQLFAPAEAPVAAPEVAEENPENMEVEHDEEEAEVDNTLADLQEIQNTLNNEEDLTVGSAPEVVEVAALQDAPAAEAAPVAGPVTPVVETPVVPVAEPVTESAPVAATPVIESTPPVDLTAQQVESPVIDEDGTMNTSGNPIEVEHEEGEEENNDNFLASSKETVIAVPEGFDVNAPADDGSAKYGKMLEDALAESTPQTNPAMMSAPVVATQPEIKGVPEINYAPAPNVDILPPPPAPTVMPGMPAQASPFVQPAPAPVQPVAAVPQPMPQPVAQAAPIPADVIQSRPPVQLVAPAQPATPAAPAPAPAADPAAMFKIPGM